MLNWKNADVKSTINGAIQKFLDLGVDGFHIDHISQLAVDSKGRPNVSQLPKETYKLYSKFQHDEAVKVLEELTKSVQIYVESRDELVDKKMYGFSC